MPPHSLSVSTQNKKQRTAVREAVLRMKDPIVILKEIEEIEKAESELISGSSEPLPNEKGLLEKKRKLHSNLDRIVKYWVGAVFVSRVM